MDRLQLYSTEKSQDVMDGLYEDMSRRLVFSPKGNCPVSMTNAFLKLTLAQSCGKCVPCRIGLDTLASITDKILSGKGSENDLQVIEKTATVIADSADCAIGFEAAKLVLDGFRAFRDDYISHMKNNRCTVNFKSVPCVFDCPAHVDIPGYISLIKEGRYADAIRLIRKDNPFPSVCGLVCEHPCESHCRRGMVDAPINIRGLKRFAVDTVGEIPPPEISVPLTGKKVAVIGGGPAGLSAAYYLSLMGHSVTIFEKRQRLGGMLRYGIPSYRLPDDYLDRDINTILSLGVKVNLGVSVGTDITLEDLRGQFDSVYISIGAHADKKLKIKGEDSRGVISAVELLGNMGDGNKPDFTGKRVVVLGGGNVAMDATRTAMRLNAASVTCVYRRRVEDMTALKEEVEGAMAEGCEILPLMAPVEVQADENGNVTGVVLQPQIIGKYEGGRPKPSNADKPAEVLPCDIIIVAVGQAIDATHFADSGVKLKWDQILTQKGTAIYGMEGVFAGGDCISGPLTVIRAIDGGKVAAANIDNYLGYDTKITAGLEVPPASYRFKPAHGRINLTERNANERKNDFCLMENEMSLEEATQECSRCLRCDHYGFGSFKGGREYQW